MSARWISRKRLPHFDVPGLIQHITFHLADSLPKTAIERMQMEINAMPESQRAVSKRRRVQESLDTGMGSCLLCRPVYANIVQDSLLFGDGERYRLLAWVVMPNHVHTLIEQIPGWPLAKVVQSWKRHTSRQIHRLDSESGGLGRAQENVDHKSKIPGLTVFPRLWQRDYWDRFIRDERHFATARHYIESNPVTADLVRTAEEWPWGSAGLRIAASLPDVRLC